MLQVVHNDISVLVKNSKSNKQMELRRQMIGEKHIPERQDVVPGKLALEPHQEPSEAKEKVKTISVFQMLVKTRIHELEHHIHCQ